MTASTLHHWILSRCQGCRRIVNSMEKSTKHFTLKRFERICHANLVADEIHMILHWKLTIPSIRLMVMMNKIHCIILLKWPHPFHGFASSNYYFEFLKCGYSTRSKSSYLKYNHFPKWIFPRFYSIFEKKKIQFFRSLFSICLSLFWIK